MGSIERIKITANEMRDAAENTDCRCGRVSKKAKSELKQGKALNGFRALPLK
jgi:hypothetical protein